MGDANKICTLFRRPKFRKSNDIGYWYTIFIMITVIGIFTNIGIFAVTYKGLHRFFSNRYWDWAFVFAFVYSAHLILLAVAHGIDSVPDAVLRKQAMAEYEANLLQEIKDTVKLAAAD